MNRRWKEESIGLYWKFDFGKYKGHELQEIAEDDPKYVKWCVDEVEWFEESLKEGVVDELGI